MLTRLTSKNADRGNVELSIFSFTLVCWIWLSFFLSLSHLLLLRLSKYELIAFIISRKSCTLCLSHLSLFKLQFSFLSFYLVFILCSLVFFHNFANLGFILDYSFLFPISLILFTYIYIFGFVWLVGFDLGAIPDAQGLFLTYMFQDPVGFQKSYMLSEVKFGSSRKQNPYLLYLQSGPFLHISDRLLNLSAKFLVFSFYHIYLEKLLCKFLYFISI